MFRYNKSAEYELSRKENVMDQTVTGKFIKEIRKERGLTQKELAEKTGVSEKAVSKWETGRGFPDTGLILPLAEALQVSVNELLSGQKLDDKNFAAKAEENFSVLLKDKVSAKTKSAAAWLSFAAVLFSALILIVACAGIAEIHVWVRVALIIAAFLSLFSFTVLVCVQGASNEIFECPLCGEKFSVSLFCYIAAPHTLVKRRLKCPRCGKNSWCTSFFRK